MNWTEEIPSLSIEVQANGNLRIEDTSYGEGAIVDVHPCQVRLMAERLGLLPGVPTEAMDAGYADCRGGSLYSELERLAHWLELIEARADQLHDNIMASSMRGHEDLDIEVAQSSALADIIEQVRKDAQAAFARGVTRSHDVSRMEPDRIPIAPKSPEIGGVEDPQNRVASTGPQGELL